MTILYDGDCPFCTAYVGMARLRRDVGNVVLLSAREPHPEVTAIAAAGYDLNAGMVVIWRGRIFHGSQAVHLLAILASDGGWFNRFQRLVFGGPRRAAMLYPLLAAGRRVWLRLSGASLISHGPKSSDQRE
ncbi:DCC1-like thiol-disulfide oxidoreductase family protein [Fertoeibacter niger]|uniref:DCC1-like thiol-disulfide oxidoreductase family protein n=1 Tax=Fertoeibacter niger TaxID=2656921 RepID=UPI001C2D8873|nr:DCC1-like thiol-disulfide oxidoreductase family protein [Fertoeibacter niger]